MSGRVSTFVFFLAFDSPLTVLSRLTTSTLRSSAFLAVYVSSYMSLVCLARNAHLLNILTRDHKTLYYIFGLISASSIFIERKGRRGELAAYVLPKAAESAWVVGVDRGLLPKSVKGGSSAMFALGCGLLMVSFEWSQAMNERQRRLLTPFSDRDSIKLLRAISARSFML